jgi:hypothetical protein
MYRHLYDGGVSDNLGWQTIREAAYNYFDHAPKGARASGCYVFVIDAHTGRTDLAQAFSTDARGPFANTFDVAGALDSVSSLMDEQRYRLLSEPIGEGLRTLPWGADPKEQPSEVAWQCHVWHFSFDVLSRLVARYGPKKGDLRDAFELFPEEARAHTQLEALTNEVRTDFRLSGPQSCTESDLKDAISTAARLLVHEDRELLQAAHEWFQKRFGDLPPLPPQAALYKDTTRIQVVTRAGVGQTVNCNRQEAPRD